MTRVTLIDETLPEDGARIVPALADYGLETLVQKGQTIDVPAELAGVRPYFRKMTDEELADQSHMHHVAAPNGILEPGKTTMHDLGYGLLAQESVWAPAETTEGD